MLLAIFSVILMLDYPLEPSQVSLISMFTIGIPGFLLALEPNKERIKGKFIKKVLLEPAFLLYKTAPAAANANPPRV